jgi:hypothetical protein
VKILRLLLLMIVTLVVAIMATRHSTAQPAGPPEEKGALTKYEQLVLSLSKSGQSATVTRLVSVISSMQAEHNAADVGIIVAVLERLRSGRTNDAVQLLETRLDGALVGIGTAPQDARNANVNSAARMAQRYRGEHPHKAGTPEVEAAIVRAFASLPSP